MVVLCLQILQSLFWGEGVRTFIFGICCKVVVNNHVNVVFQEALY